MSRSNRSARSAGTRFETMCARYLSAKTGLRVERRAKKGRDDQGDLVNVETASGVQLVVECKDYAGKYAGMLPQWVGEAEDERLNANADGGVVVVKRRGCGEAGMGDQFVVMTLDTLIVLMGDFRK